LPSFLTGIGLSSMPKSVPNLGAAFNAKEVNKIRKAE
jgi:hypothetical protein